MGYKIDFLPDAEFDLDEVLSWYGQINLQLAADFLDKLDKTLLTLQSSPLQFQKVFKNYRKLNLKRFPFKVISRVEKETVIIAAIAHHKRNAKYWKGRE